MKRVLFSMVLLMTVGFTFAQVKNVKEAKSLIEETGFSKSTGINRRSVD